MKQFFFRLFTVLVLAIACTLLIQQRNWLWLCVIVPSFLVSIGWFYRLYTFNTRKIAFLLDAIENDDPAVRFYEHASPGDSSMVNVMLNRIARILYNVKQETAQREKYYELIMELCRNRHSGTEQQRLRLSKEQRGHESVGAGCSDSCQTTLRTRMN